MKTIMETITERKAIYYQEAARLRHQASRCQIADCAPRYAKEDQEEAAHLYRMARAWMGCTNGDVRKADQHVDLPASPGATTP